MMTIYVPVRAGAERPILGADVMSGIRSALSASSGLSSALLLFHTTQPQLLSGLKRDTPVLHL